jgi:hypothetical protein
LSKSIVLLPTLQAHVFFADECIGITPEDTSAEIGQIMWSAFPLLDMFLDFLEEDGEHQREKMEKEPTVDSGDGESEDGHEHLAREIARIDVACAAKEKEKRIRRRGIDGQSGNVSSKSGSELVVGGS